MRQVARRRIECFIFILPLLVVLAMVAIPIAQTATMSLSDYDVLSGSRAHAFVGLDNYSGVLGLPRFWRMARITLWYTLFSVVGKMAAGLMVALILNAKVIGRGFLRSLIVIPWAMPGIVVAMLFTLLLDPLYGVINASLESVGLIHTGIPFISEVNLALPVVICIGIWKNFPFVALMLLAALQGVPPELYEAAEVDGASGLQKFLSITWPMIFPVWIIMLILQVVGTIKEFDLIFLVTAGGPALSTNVIGLDIYRNAFKFFKLGEASAEGIILMAICLVFAVIYYRYEFKKR
jgi:multiple sugar transport system permease protein